MPTKATKGGRGEQADAGDGLEGEGGWEVLGQGLQFEFGVADGVFDLMDFLGGAQEGRVQGFGHGSRRIGECGLDRRQDVSRSQGDGDTELAQ